MKLYILADMEGIAGIRFMEQVKRDHPEHYAEGCALMMKELNAAVDGLFAAGASEVTVCDTHAMGGQLKLSNMDPRAIYEMPNAGRMMPSLDATYDGLILMGVHAMAGTQDGFLDHTFNSGTIFDYAINGTSVGEIGVQALYAAHFGVPILAVSGDAAGVREAEAILGTIPTVAVKTGIGRNRAHCLAPDVAHARQREMYREALATSKERKALDSEYPGTLSITFYRQDMADDLMREPSWTRESARTISRQIRSGLEVYPL